MNYYLGDANQNTFLFFDRLESPVVDKAFLQQAHHYLIEEKKDDALILYDGTVIEDAFYARMLVLGMDGVIAEFCGNGTRVCAAYLFAHYPRFEKFFLKMDKESYPLLKYEDAVYSIKLKSPSFELNQKFIADVTLLNGLTGFSYVDMLEPHLIVQETLGDEELFALGRELNQRKDLFPKGINVNGWNVLQDGQIFVKTYERGVQRLTRSCGTGSISCAAFYKPKGRVSVETPGGFLEITFEEDRVELKGPAFFFCKNKIEKQG